MTRARNDAGRREVTADRRSPSPWRAKRGRRVTAARVIANSGQPRETTLFGSDPNWGRVVAVGAWRSFTVDPNRDHVAFNGRAGLRDGPERRARDVESVGAPTSGHRRLNVGERSATIRRPPTRRTRHVGRLGVTNSDRH